MTVTDQPTTGPRTAAGTRTAVDHGAWLDVCALDDLVPERGAAALVGAAQVALFRLLGDEVLAIGNQDPFSGAHVLSRGVVGTRGDVPMVAGPLYKQHFDLRTGRCLEDPGAAVPVYPVRVEHGRVQLCADPGGAAAAPGPDA